jgi:hypothetical protein
MLAANGDDRLRRLIRRSELRGMPVANRLPQRRDAWRRRIFRAILLESFDRRPLDMSGSPGPKSATSIPCAFKRSAACSTAIVWDTLMRFRRSAS